MSDFAGLIDSKLSALLGDHEPRHSNLSATAYSALDTPNQSESLETFGLLAFLRSGAVLGPQALGGAQESPIDLPGFLARDLADEWFERIILSPARIDFGNVLSSQVRNVEVLNNYRSVGQNWSALNDLSGGEVTTGSVPPLPLVLNPLQADTITVSIAVDGAPTIDSALEFVFDVVTLLLPITATRVILFPFVPEAPVLETLRFFTDVLAHADGSEQRIGKRKAPRQILDYRFFMDADNERERLNAILYDWQDKVFGVPIWWEARSLTSAITAPTDTIQVDTNYGDFRVGGLAAIYGTFGDFEILEILSLTSSQIVFTSDVQTSRQVSEVVIVPVRTAYAQQEISQTRAPVGPTRTNVRFLTLDNEDLGSVGGFGTYNSKVLIDRPNIMKSASVDEGFRRKLETLDSKIAPPVQISTWLKSKPRIHLGLNGHTLQESWEIRQMFHALSGRLTSFYLGTGRNEIIPTANIADTAVDIPFVFQDFVKFFESVPLAPRGHVQITRTNGNKSQHQITGAVVITPGVEEQITVTPAVTPALPLVDLERIEFLTLSRLLSDDVAIEHLRPGETKFTVGVIGVTA